MDDIVNPLLLKVKKASPMYILGQDANIVEDYEYLGVLVTSRQTNAEAVHKRGRKLTSFTVCSRVMVLLYTLILAAAAYSAEHL